MSVEQEEELRRYFGLGVPAQAPPADAELTDAKAGQAGEAGKAGQAGLAGRAAASPGGQPEPTRTREVRQPSGGGTGQEWLVRSEERIAVSLETQETGRIKLHKYVDTEPIEQTVRVFREEYEIERIPVTADDRIGDDLAEREQEIILHEARAIVTKETVPVERVRLSVRKIEEDKKVSGEIRKERIEVDSAASPAASPGSGQPSPSSGRPGQPGSSGRRR
jgi:uncharacterized protein (TIGR02271 family)